VRRGSNASDRRRKKAAPGARVQKLTSAAGSRSATPEVPSPLVRENSFNSVSSRDSERPSTPVRGDKESSKSLRDSAQPGGSPARKSSSSRATKQS
jgi:hypothetical protein